MIKKYIPGMMVKIKDLTGKDVSDERMRSCAGRLAMIYNSKEINDTIIYDLITLKIDEIECVWWPEEFLEIANNNEITQYFIDSECPMDEIKDYIQCIYN